LHFAVEENLAHFEALLQVRLSCSDFRVSLSVHRGHSFRSEGKRNPAAIREFLFI
jgi:hypothetical protein